MADEINIVVRATDSFSGVLGNFGSIITGIESALRLAGDGFRLFRDYALQGLDAIATYERLTATLETLSAVQALQAGTAENMTEALAETSGEAQELLEWMQELAIKSPFTLEGVANAFRTAEAYGFTAEEAKRLTQALIDFAAGSGASEDAMSRIALALGQIEAKGKLSGQEVLQLVNAGLPVTQILANAFGVTTAELEKMREDGLIPAQDAIEAITDYLENNFAGAAERQANTWAGLQGTFADIKQMGLREFFGGMFDVLQPLAIELSNFLQTEGMDRLAEWGNRLGTITQNVINLVQNLQGMSAVDITEMFSSWIDGVDWEQLSRDFAEGLNSINWDAVSEGFGNLSDAFTNILIGIDWSAVAGAVWESLIQAFTVVIDNGADSLIQILADAFGDPDVATFTAGVQGGYDVLIGIITDIFSFGFDDIGRNIVQGIVAGIRWAWGNLISALSFGFDDVIVFVMDKLGISSPSTVFANIGRNIVLGLINGIDSMIGSLVGLIEDMLSLMLGPIQPILDLLGIDLGTGTTGSHNTGGGTTGGRSGTGGTGDSGLGQTVNNYFYGPVYFNQSAEDTNYDCPSPHPLLTASQGSLLTSGI